MLLLALLSIGLLVSESHGQTVYLAGDSTMALNGAGKGTGTDGWGQYLGQYMTIPVVNMGVGGTSARSYTNQGRFTTIYNTVKKGDFVVIEFGHNDGNSTPDNGNSDAVGVNYTAVATVTASNGATSVIHTFDYYIDNAIRNITQRGATAIVSSLTPDNIWANGTITPAPRFQAYAQQCSVNTKAPYVDHYSYVAQAFNNLGETTVNTYFPNGHVHTTPTGANVVAEAFVRGLLCGGSTLANKVNANGLKVPNGCL